MRFNALQGIFLTLVADSNAPVAVTEFVVCVIGDDDQQAIDLVSPNLKQETD